MSCPVSCAACAAGGNTPSGVVLDDEYGPEDDEDLYPCPVCGTTDIECGYDDLGRPYVHSDADFDREPRRAVDDVQTGGLT